MADAAALEERRIVVAVDEGEESSYALRWCLRNLIPCATRNTLILLYARPPPPVYTAMDGIENRRKRYIFGNEKDFVPYVEVPETGYLFSDDVVASIDGYTKDLANSVMERAKKICSEYNNVKVDEKVVVGDPRDVICEMVGKLGADILVLGSHGYGFIKRALLGSVSNHCARNAKCPVLIVKRPAN